MAPLNLHVLGPLESHAGSRGVLELATPVPGVLFSRFRGDLSADLARILAARLMREATTNPGFSSYSDWEAMDAYETESRVVLTDTSKAIKSRMGKVHILVRSRVVALGIDVANVVLRNIVSFHDRGAFERELTGAIAARRSSIPPR
jgi:hypothetical protein